MPNNRAPGGRSRKITRDRRRIEPIRPKTTSVTPGYDSPDDADAAGGTISTGPISRPNSYPMPQPRQSLLTNVRRPARPSGPSLSTDYHYITADLKRIGMLVLAAFIILLALTLVIR